ncbi:MAG: glycerol-3-phosphate 1-O-acyltransferase PlsY [Coriobacteriia bacterium]|nr:glycerol-3-phosphate 1-O-acyltransferase PlsY [Coriobacteriia bacterium]MCL2537167.1 glycerol-3-phosphate 1-O-acyltransferase PlsY [Coriobacteriia bacterium]
MSFFVDLFLLLPAGLVFVAVTLFAYLFGAIPFAMMVGKIFFKVNLLKEGSGNLGATNTFRILGAKAGIGILLLDMAKGAIPVFLARSIAGAAGWDQALSAWLMIAAALAAIIGHTASPYIRFKGGKGAATTAGVMFALVPVVFVISAAIFFSTTAITRYVSVGTMVTAVSFPLWTALVYNNWPLTLFAAVIAVIVPIFHRANIKRLREGSEPRFSWKDRGKRTRPSESE